MDFSVFCYCSSWRNYFHIFLVTFARKDNSLRINWLVGLLEYWVTR